ncbi:MAG: TMEM143 family protein [Desulfobacterales bacterium]|nr:TMEM143 family protein [Desulfobacterales bacterium]
MPDTTNRNRFIPFRKADIVDMCVETSALTKTDTKAFRELCQILEALFHFEFYSLLEKLKTCYAPFNPDADTRSVSKHSAEEKKDLQKQLVQEMTSVLTAANYEKITAQDLKQALGEESLFQIRLEVDFEDFEDVIFFRRGESTKEETLVKFFGLWKKKFNFTNYDRVAIYIKFKEADYFEKQKRTHLYFEPGSTVIKLFHNVPKADLEMLFPNSNVRMKTIDKIIIGVPAAISGIIVLVTKLGASLLLVGSVISFWLGFKDEQVQIKQQHLIALGAGLGTLGGFLFRQINKYKNRKIKFMKALADNLYFKNLDNNAGVFFHLIDTAEEEEFKEAVLAYFFLLTAKEPLTKSALDQRIEKWLADRWGCHIDFEIGDAIQKLQRLKLIAADNDHLRCVPLDSAKQQLDTIWDNYFTYNLSRET